MNTAKSCMYWVSKFTPRECTQCTKYHSKSPYQFVRWTLALGHSAIMSIVRQWRLYLSLNGICSNCASYALHCTPPLFSYSQSSPTSSDTPPLGGRGGNPNKQKIGNQIRNPVGGWSGATMRFPVLFKFTLGARSRNYVNVVLTPFEFSIR